MPEPLSLRDEARAAMLRAIETTPWPEAATGNGQRARLWREAVAAACVDAALSVTREHAERLIRDHGGCDDDSMVTLPQDALLALLGEASATPEPRDLRYDDIDGLNPLPSHDQEQP